MASRYPPLSSLAFALVLGTAAAAHAGPPAGAKPAAAASKPAKPAAAAKPEAHEAHEAHGADEAHEHAAPPGSAASAKGHAVADAAHDGGKEARDVARGDAGPPGQDRAERQEARKKHREEIRAKWGDDLLRHPAVESELKTHAWRMARLHRIRQLAEAAGKKDVVARVDKLIEKEQARHDKHMDTLKSKGGEE